MYNLVRIKKIIMTLTVISMIGFYILNSIEKLTLLGVELNFFMLTVFFLFVFYMQYNSIYKERIWSCFALSYGAFIPSIFLLIDSIENFSLISVVYSRIYVATNISFIIMLFFNNVYREILEDNRKKNIDN